MRNISVTMCSISNNNQKQNHCPHESLNIKARSSTPKHQHQAQYPPLTIHITNNYFVEQTTVSNDASQPSQSDTFRSKSIVKPCPGTYSLVNISISGKIMSLARLGTGSSERLSVLKRIYRSPSLLVA